MKINKTYITWWDLDSTAGAVGIACGDSTAVLGMITEQVLSKKQEATAFKQW